MSSAGVASGDDFKNAAEPPPVKPSFGGRWREAPDDGTRMRKMRPKAAAAPLSLISISRKQIATNAAKRKKEKSHAALPSSFFPLLLRAQAPEPLSRHRLVALIQIHAEQRPSEADQEIDSIDHRRVLGDTKINGTHILIIIKTMQR